MSQTRRLFLHNAAFSAVAAGLFPTAFAQELLNRRSETFSREDLAVLDGVSMQTFEPWIGSRFLVSLKKKPLGSLILLSVDKIDPPADDSAGSTNGAHQSGPVPRPGPAVTSFAIRFRRPGKPLPQDTYTLSHDWLGKFPLLLVPSGLTGPNSTCTAVFSLLEQAALKKS
jgi:hypothetical protein